MVFVESELIELKLYVVADICKEVIAFANTKGGTIYIGVDNNGVVHGVEDSDKTILQLNHMIRDTIKPDVTMFVSYDILNIDDKKVIEVQIQKGTNKPYYLGGKGLKSSGVFVRNGTSCDQASDVMIHKMIKESDGDSFEKMRSIHQNLTFNVAKVQFEKRNIQFNFEKMKSLNMVSQDGVYTNLGLLLSDQCEHTIKVATFNGVTKTNFHDRQEFSGSLFQQMEEAYAYLSLRNKVRATFDGLYRIDSNDYPQDAIRESLLNAIIHRLYSYSASTLISVYDDRIEFVSIGGLPQDIEIEDILIGISVCRNEKLAAIFYRLELIEAYGTGIQKIMEAYQDCLVKPKIEVSKNAFKITLPNRNEVNEEVEVKRNLNKSEEEIILDYLRNNDVITRKEVENILNVSQATAVRILKQLLNKDIIIPYGNGKNIKYLRK